MRLRARSQWNVAERVSRLPIISVVFKGYVKEPYIFSHVKTTDPKSHHELLLRRDLKRKWPRHRLKGLEILTNDDRSLECF